MWPISSSIAHIYEASARRDHRFLRGTMPSELSRRELWDLIADSIATYLKSYEVADFCEMLGLAPEAEGEDPFRSKRVYVRSKLTKLSLEELRELARRVAEELGDSGLTDHLGHGGFRGVDGELKNIIFASAGPKPRIIMTDAINNVIEVVENKNSCLVYNRRLLSPGLTWGELVDWWSVSPGGDDPKEVARCLYRRLCESLGSGPEAKLFRTYCGRYGEAGGFNLPALLPQVYLCYDPYTRAERRAVGEIRRERMDFLMLLPNRVRVVLEVDGKQHYADDIGLASPRRYSEMVAEDRKIRLRGYEVYRFGGAELMQHSATAMLDNFFEQLLVLHT